MFANIFSHFVAWLLIFLTMYFEEHKYLILMISNIYFLWLVLFVSCLINLCLPQVHYFSLYATILNSIDLHSGSRIFLLLCQIRLKFKYQLSKTFCFFIPVPNLPSCQRGWMLYYIICWTGSGFGYNSFQNILKVNSASPSRRALELKMTILPDLKTVWPWTC